MISRKLLLGCALVGLLPFAAVVAAENQYVVISVVGPVPDVKEGQTIDAGAQIILPPATAVRLLSAAGRTIALDGPFSGRIAVPPSTAAGDSQIIARLARFLSEQRVSGGALGAMRSGVTVPQSREPDDPWQIVVEESGTQCGRPPDIQLWRKNAASEMKVRLSSTHADLVRATWLRGQNILPLPAQFAVDQSTFRIGIGDHAAMISLRLVPANLSNPAEIADWMVKVNCRRQAALFLETLR